MLSKKSPPPPSPTRDRGPDIDRREGRSLGGPKTAGEEERREEGGCLFSAKSLQCRTAHTHTYKSDFLSYSLFLFFSS